MLTIILFVLVLSLLVFVHEFGHFVAARKSGMKVHEFGFGFPPRAVGVYKDPKTGTWKWVKGAKKQDLKNTVGGGDREDQDEYPSTVYSLNWLPLGGFVRIKGENGEEANAPDSFGYQKTWKKVVVLVAGVTMNFVLAAVLLGFGFMIGLPTDVTDGLDESGILIGEPTVVIQQVEHDSPADMAGLKSGDTIHAIDDIAIHNTKEMIEYVADHAGEQLSVFITRGEEKQTVDITPIQDQETEQVRIGVAIADAAIVRYPWYLAIWKGLVAAVLGTIGIFVGFFILIKGLLFGQGLAFDVAGPVGIASIIGDSARLGINYLINVTAMISLSLAVINILPIPALDGGRLVFVLIEKICKKKVSLKYEQLAHTIGFVLLLILIIVVTVRDVSGLF
ncbi:MAG: RIP metalloprotease RseP [Candidatus Magasanikbacteria bacterium CG10_big_fil_rev_8_21_14_0_10_43_6]|uniref:Zinc metalloprotease n=1 Tax=Candidatus Magasanikbacteria bacterium CG10_big_fil_rev_8_21_14_0_10_43_6 TaxID=1974650 RepID=A0A2M6W088_9BACT|nr:MAG: RIP metalloprotease RseP [Candidatus Magasanikbacteria bacterium CG10_big_fil_rev_8_21_14_0_10_43_6]